MFLNTGEPLEIALGDIFGLGIGKVGIESSGHPLDAAQSAGVRVLNAVGEPEWIAMEPSSGNRRVFVLRGTFRFDPELAAYPFDTQLLTIRLAADGHAVDALLSPVPGIADVECAIPGWRVESGHRATCVQARCSADGAPKVHHGIEFGIRARRVRHLEGRARVGARRLLPGRARGLRY